MADYTAPKSLGFRISPILQNKSATLFLGMGIV